MIEQLLLGGIAFYAIFRIFFYLLKARPDDSWGYFTFTTAGDTTLNMNDSWLNSAGTASYWSNQTTSGTATTTSFEIT